MLVLRLWKKLENGITVVEWRPFVIFRGITRTILICNVHMHVASCVNVGRTVSTGTVVKLSSPNSATGITRSGGGVRVVQRALLIRAQSGVQRFTLRCDSYFILLMLFAESRYEDAKM